MSLHPADGTIGFIGAGRMAEAIVRGLIAGGLATPERISLADPDENRRRLFAEAGCSVEAENGPVAAGAGILILAVKPQNVDGVLAGLIGSLAPRTLVVSIAAGVPCARIERILPAGTRVVRVMPNTPMTVGRGVSGVARGAAATGEDVKAVLQIFGAAGFAVEVREEDLHAVTALSGSGPAYYFRFTELLAAAGQRLGLSEELARVLAKGTFLGAAELLSQSGAAPEELRAQVTSPGGTTAAALAHLEAEGLERVMDGALAAAAARSRELGGT